MDGVQWLTLVHFSAHPEPLKSLKSHNIPQKVLTSSRKVDECKPLDGVMPYVVLAAAADFEAQAGNSLGSRLLGTRRRLLHRGVAAQVETENKT